MDPSEVYLILIALKVGREMEGGESLRGMRTSVVIPEERDDILPREKTGNFRSSGLLNVKFTGVGNTAAVLTM